LKLIIEVECGEKTCGDCPWRRRAYPTDCRLFDKYLDVGKERPWPIRRLTACLAAGEKFSAIERRYAELIEDVSRRIDQAKGEK
jgi:hypothetical protein